MRRGTLLLLLFIVLLAVGAAYVNFWPHVDANSKSKPLYGINNPFLFKEGLDLQGGVSVLLKPDPSQHYTKAQVDANIDNTLNQIERRVNGGLGVNEPVIRKLSDSQGNQSIALDLPGLNQPDAVNTLLKPGKLEFWDTGSTPIAEGTVLDVTCLIHPQDPSCAQKTPQTDATQFQKNNPGGKPLFTGADLDPSQISVGTDQNTNQIVINFEMKGDAIARFGDFTGKHISDFLTITLDRKVISSASINSQINGPGIIQGQFTQAQAQSIVTVLQYGALPLALVIDSSETVGATLGQDSIYKSVIAGIIGLSIVVLFMLLYYRLPGLLADLALVLYALFVLAVFKVFGFTLTLPGIAGFVLSVGMAVDANVLIFERVKEELRAGRLMASAIDIGWKRAWPSIRDSNISTLITCAVLFYFGSNFGAAPIVGFATNLFLGVVVSMFTAIIVTRTFLNLLVPTGVINHPALFGLPADAVPSTSLTRRSSTV